MKSNLNAPGFLCLTVLVLLTSSFTKLLAQTPNTPVVGLPCYVNGDPNQTPFGISDAFLMVNYDPSSSTNPLGTSNDIVILGRDEEIGSTWGVAYNANTGNFYASSVLKRHVGLPTSNGLLPASNTLGAIYSMNGRSDANGNRLTAPVLLADLAALGYNVGSLATIGTNAARSLGRATSLQPDPVTFPLVGKMGIGDIDISPDKRTLYAIALGDGNGAAPQLVRLDITMEDNVMPLGAIDITSGSTGITGTVRPWGLGINQATGEIYLGVVTEGNGALSPGSGYILRFDEAAGAFTQVLDFPLGYARTPNGVPSVCDADWNGWTDTYPTTFNCGVADPYYDAYGQPIISDIEILNDGTFIVALMDRFGLQTGSSQQKPDGSPGSAIWGAAAERGRPVGDILTFGPGSNSGSVPANNGPNYSDNSSGPEDKAALGGLAIQPGGTQILVPAVDPDVANSNGLTAMELGTGARIDNQNIISGNGTGVAEKGIALGDVEIGVANPVNICTVNSVAASATCVGEDMADIIVTFNYSNAPIGNVFTVDVMGTTMTVPAEGSGVLRDTFPAFDVTGGGQVTISVTGTDAGCTGSTVFDLPNCPAPSACSYNNDFQISGICNDQGTADPADDMIELTFSGSFDNLSGPNYSIAFFTGTGPNTGPFIFSGGLNGGMPQTAMFSATTNGPIGFAILDPMDTDCISEIIELDVAPCSVPPPACDLDITGLDGMPTCQADGTYSITVLVDYTNAPGGDIQIGVTAGGVGFSGTLATTAGGSMTGQMVVIDGLPSDGSTDLDLFGSFLAQPDCGEVQNVTFADPACAQPSCPPDLAAPTVAGECNDNGTNADATDDFIAVTFTANTGGRGNYEVLVDGNPLMPSVQAADGQTLVFNLPAVASGNAGISYRLVFDPLTSCASPDPVSVALDPCPTEPACDLMFVGTLMEGACNDQGDTDPDNDATMYTIPANTVAAATGGQQYDVLVNGTPVVSAVPFNQLAEFEVPNDGRMQFITIRQTDRVECTVDIAPFMTSPGGCPQEDDSGGDCALTINSSSTVCNYDAASGSLSFELTFEVQVTSSVAENVEVTLGDELLAAFTNAAGETEIIITTVTVAEPKFNVPLVARSTTMGSTCSDARLLDFIACTDACTDPVGANTVGGNVFLDNNNNGTNDMESGQGNVLVRVYDCEENLICEVYTNEAGNWSCDGAMAGDTFRVEYTTPLTPYLTESFAGDDNGTSTQFLVGGTCGADYGVLDLSEYCNAFMLSYAIACYESGSFMGAPNADNAAFISFESGESGNASAPSKDIELDQIGSVWGTAHVSSSSQVFAGTILKRHSAFINSLGTIYQLDYTDIDNPSFVAAVDLTGVTPLNRPGQPLEFGSVCRGQGGCESLPGNTGVLTDYELPNDPTAPSIDLDAFGKVGKVGYGDIDYDPATGLLWAVNLAERTLLSFDPASPATTVNAYPIAGATGLPTCANGEVRPWALEFRKGQGYLGVVCDGSVTNDRMDISALIVRFDPTNPAAGFSAFQEVDLAESARNFTFYGESNLTETRFQAWVTDYEDYPQRLRDSLAIKDFGITYGQPILSDIDFGPSGALAVSIMDRNTLQITNKQFIPISGTTRQTGNIFNAGELFHFCPTAGGGFEKEGEGDCVPGNADVNSPFYNGDDYYDLQSGDGLSNAAIGSHVYDPSGQLIVAVYDPFPPGTPSNSPGFDQSPYLNSQGLHYYNTTTGAREDWYQIVERDDTPQSVGKGTGLGDLIALCDEAPVQIGNYAWLDTDADGLQDPCEPPLAGLAVKLYRKNSDGSDPVLIATDTTDMSGNYYFSSAAVAAGDDDQNWIGMNADTTISRDSTYFVAFCGEDGYNADQDRLSVNGQVLCASPADAGQAPNDNQNDSDITELAVGTEMLPAYCTTDGELTDGTNHTFDAGFKVVCPFVDLLLTAPGICGADSIQLTTVVDSVFAADTYDYVWSSTGSGMFVGADNMVTMDYNDALFYVPSEADRTSGSVTLSLRSSAATTPAACEEVMDMITIAILNVDCGEFFWDGSGN